MNIFSTTRRMLRGDISARTLAQEASRRFRLLSTQRRERASLSTLAQQPAHLREEFARLRPSDLLAHFRSRVKPKFFPGFGQVKRTAALQQKFFPGETGQLLDQADRIAGEHCWSLLGFAEKCFGAEDIQWHRDPLSRYEWPLTYHGDISLVRQDGSDVRVVWELNRLSHFITLGRAYSITNNEKFAVEFFSQLSNWRAQNPVARGVNWNCAMEVALRAMNLVAAFVLFLSAPELNEISLKELLKTFDQHGAHIQRNLEFSHIATSNHYLADVTGLLWLGLMLPELSAAEKWREFGLREMLGEMDKQVLPDGADYEASTGYHRLKVELFLYSFVLCHVNGVDIEERYWNKLRAMVGYVAAYMRPDGRAPLIGDSDSGQALPLVRRAGDDHAYVLTLGAAVFQEPRFKLSGSYAPEELLWILGEQGVRDYQALPEGARHSESFPDAGVYVLRRDDLYLLMNASDSGVKGRGSHGHNDALSLEVSACGTAFIIDPGTYLYTANLHERHLFRSTGYHSTVEVDEAEQNAIDEAIPFIIGNEAEPRVLSWETSQEADVLVAEHYGYRRLAQPVTHRRTVRFDKQNRFWLVEDDMSGMGRHEFSFRFHFAPGLEISVRPDGIIEAWDKMSGARLLIVCQKPCRQGGPSVANRIEREPVLESRFSSNDYGAKRESVSGCWTVQAPLPLTVHFALIPVRRGEHEDERMAIVSEARA